MKMRRTLLLVAAVASLFGCVERAAELSPADRERLREHVGTERPSPEHELDVQFDNGISLIGYDITTETATPGTAFSVTWYWHAAQDMDDGWVLFTHVADAAGESRLNQDRVGTVREMYQPGRWREGQYITDVQEVTLPADWNSDQAVFYLGMWNPPHRLTVRRGPNDGDNRVRALALEVSSSPSAAADSPAAAQRRAAGPTPSLRAPQANMPIEIDGALNEAAWANAGRTQAFVNTQTGGRAPFTATVRTLWDDENLYVAFDVQDTFIQNTHDERDAHLWEQDAVEIMIDPGGEGRNYFELQVSPTGQVFDTRYDSRRNPRPIGHADWNADITAETSLRGTANDAEADEGYTVEIAIAWSSFNAGAPAASRPAPNARWRMNFYVMDQHSAEENDDRAAGWSPTLEGDFHVPARFGNVTFAGPAREVAAADGQARPARPQVIEAADVLSPTTVRALRGELGNQGNVALRRALQRQRAH
ncbi:MAG: carbohydrate-binding family 9-like protein [Sandaracinaceae bacterium]